MQFRTCFPARLSCCAQDALAHGLPVNVTFTQQEVSGYTAAIDTDNRLQQVGWQRQASLMPLAWAAQWLHYAQGLKQRLQAPALVVPVFEKQVHWGPAGIVEHRTIALAGAFLWCQSPSLAGHAHGDAGSSSLL